MEYLDSNQLSESENGKKRYLTFSSALILLIVFFILASGFFWWLNKCGLTVKCKTAQNISNLEISGHIIKKNETIAVLTAQVVKKQIDTLLTVGSFYADKRELIQLIQQGKWQDAINLASGILEEIPQNSVDKIDLFDVSGTLQANIPEDKEVRGKNFAFRDWYRGVATDFKPYVSEVFERTERPNFNVIILAFPIFNSKNITLGFMTLQIKTDVFLEWLKELKFGNSGLSFIIDQRGHIVAHPEIPPQGAIADYSSRTEVQKVISGQSGTEISFGPKNQRILSSYEPIPNLHWGIITRIELDEVVNSGFINYNSLESNQNRTEKGIIRKMIEKIITPWF
ncbi:MAG: cache domain-containing protein [Candidatus Yanofskybacteria bacterium]|nr:cache domain-containing protein [Candidatus Yanofskybacteria bacterium]